VALAWVRADEKKTLEHVEWSILIFFAAWKFLERKPHES